MKAGTLFLVAYALLASAQPHGHVHHAHLHQPAERALVTHAVYLDPNGHPTSTSVVMHPTPASAPPAEHHNVYYKPHHLIKHHRGNFGLSYDPNNADGTYKDTAQITADFHQIRAAGYSHVRSYRTDWGQVNHMLDASAKTGLRLFPSTYEINDLETEIPAIIQAAKGRWHLVHTVGVGNEQVNTGTASVPQVIAAVNQARQMLRAAGYQGPVVHADTFNQFLANPQLCQAGDYVAANCHAFFDPNADAASAAQYVKTQYENVIHACGGKHTRITESGWPSGGNPIGLAVPSPQNQRMVIHGLKNAFAGKHITLFMAFNEPFKAVDTGNPTEATWGILP